MFTVAEFLSQLRLHDPAKAICFCGCPQGLQFYRFKRRGDSLLQLEFGENVFRTAEGQLWIDDLTEGEIRSTEDLKPLAQTVGQMLSGFNNPDVQKFELIFGGDERALKFMGIKDIGEWVSIEFEQRIYRNANGNFVVEEVRDGRPIQEEFPLLKDREEAAGIDEVMNTRPDGNS